MHSYVEKWHAPQKSKNKGVTLYFLDDFDMVTKAKKNPEPHPPTGLVSKATIVSGAPKNLS